MNFYRNPVILAFLLVLLVAMACGFPGATATPSPVPTLIDPELPVTGEEIPPASPTKSANAPVNLPADRTSHAGDYDSSTTAAAKRAPGGDRFTFGRFERPFNADTMDVYFNYLDIVDTTAYQDNRWVYGAMIMKGTDEGGALPGRYAFELDLNLDGKGDWLILVESPASTDWTTQRVQVWNDADGDVGGLISINSDKQLATGTGYERLVADNGQGEIPEAGFMRLDPASETTLQFAISASLLGGDTSYMAGMWAGTSALDPARFDFNDYMTHEQAGAADAGLENFYPIKQLAELDNSCRMAIGFEPSGAEPGLCPELSPKPGEPDTPVCVKPTYCSGYPYIWDAKKCECYTVPPPG